VSSEAAFPFAPNPVPGLTLRGSANYNRTRYTGFIASCYTGETKEHWCKLTHYLGTTALNLAGKTLTDPPRRVAALGMLYRTDVGKDWIRVRRRWSLQRILPRQLVARPGLRPGQLCSISTRPSV